MREGGRCCCSRLALALHLAAPAPRLAAPRLSFFFFCNRDTGAGDSHYSQGRKSNLI